MSKAEFTLRVATLAAVLASEQGCEELPAAIAVDALLLVPMADVLLALAMADTGDGGTSARDGERERIANKVAHILHKYKSCRRFDYNGDVRGGGVLMLYLASGRSNGFAEGWRV